MVTNKRGERAEHKNVMRLCSCTMTNPSTKSRVIHRWIRRICIISEIDTKQKAKEEINYPENWAENERNFVFKIAPSRCELFSPFSIRRTKHESNSFTALDYARWNLMQPHVVRVKDFPYLIGWNRVCASRTTDSILNYFPIQRGGWQAREKREERRMRSKNGQQEKKRAASEEHTKLVFTFLPDQFRFRSQ